MKKVTTVLKWILPYKIIKFLTDNYTLIKYFVNNPFIALSSWRALQKNADYKNSNCGKRCFIMCTGPSINRQNLSKLKDEIVFGVSTGYLHEQYSKINPKYHIIPSVCYSEKFGYNEAVDLFHEMDVHTNIDTEFFFSIYDRELIEKNQLFKGKRVNYVAFSGDMRNNFKFDITKTIPSVQSVPIMGIIIAMYMGFKDIFLVGCDHDSVVSNKYVHAFSTKDVAPCVDKHGRIVNRTEAYICVGRLFEQYKVIYNNMSKFGIQIYNATDGGELEIFPRVNLKDIISDG